MRGVLLLALVGCSEPPICDDAPPTTWDNFGAGFVTENCQSCHASTSIDRNGAPETVTFDSEDDLWANSPDVLDVTTGDLPRMPPQGGVSDSERERLEVLLQCSQ
ncbi:MAG: cytochrome c5 [Myxococcota bacterium]|jgi:cytochrome c5